MTTTTVSLRSPDARALHLGARSDAASRAARRMEYRHRRLPAPAARTRRLLGALARRTGGRDAVAAVFDPRFRIPLAALGVTPATAHVTVTADRLVACFGPWTCRTAPANVRTVDVTGPYHWYRAIGPRLSLADHGLTFGTTPARRVCLLLRDVLAEAGF
jgi:hypothetical protein